MAIFLVVKKILQSKTLLAPLSQINRKLNSTRLCESKSWRNIAKDVWEKKIYYCDSICHFLRLEDLQQVDNLRHRKPHSNYYLQSINKNNYKPRSSIFPSQAFSRLPEKHHRLPLKDQLRKQKHRKEKLKVNKQYGAFNR